MIKRIIAGATAAGLLSLAPVAISAPANAATEVLSTAVTVEVSTTSVTYGKTISVYTKVPASDGYNSYDGTTTLYAMPAGASTWTPVATVNASYSFYDVKPTMNTTYKVVYSGYTAATQYEDTYLPSESAPFTVSVQRDVTISKAKKRLTIKGKVKPDYKRKKVTIHRKKGKRWIKVKTVKTNKKSVFQVTLPPAPRGKKLYFRITVPGNSQYVQYSEVWYTYSY
jgi:hypothetical protein